MFFDFFRKEKSRTQEPEQTIKNTAVDSIDSKEQICPYCGSKFEENQLFCNCCSPGSKWKNVAKNITNQ